MTLLATAADRLFASLGRVVSLPLEVAARWSRRRIGFVLMFHAVGDPQGDPDREFVPKRGSKLFEAQIAHVVARYRVVPAAELQDAAGRRRRGERIPVAITFDDDLRAHRDVAMPILQRLGAPATFFVCGASLDGPHVFWWEQVQMALDRGMLDTITARLPDIATRQDASVAQRVGGVVQDLSPRARDEFVAEVAGWLDEEPTDVGMPAEDVAALARAGFTNGFHTRRHDPLDGLDEAELAAALTDGLDALERAAGGPITAIAYPNGRVDDRVARAAAAAGFTDGFGIEPVAVGPDTDRFRLGRIEPSFKSVGHFAVRLARTAFVAPGR
jgi:peptidoglycan/xylan/chitin deacetylase (PgdA/CDA1 family)